MSAVAAPVVRVERLEVAYPSRGLRAATPVIRGVDLEIESGETLALVGESGSGKSTIGRAMLGLAPVTGGLIEFDGTDISHLGRRARRTAAAGLQAVFQDPYSSLNPAMTVADILAEPLLVQGRRDARTRVAELLDAVGLPADAGTRLASEFSGGQRQRIAVARALALDPRLVVCDEPTSALDVSTQARILRLFEDIQQRTGVAYLFISHDLGVVRRISDRIAVLLRGEIVETGPTADVIANPQHPYTRRLLMATPVADPVKQAARRAERRALIDQEAAADASHA